MKIHCIRLPQVQHQHLGLGHFLDRVAQPFAPHSLFLHAAVGHVVDAKQGVCGPRFSTTVQSVAMTGANLCATRFTGKLKGVIAKIGPSGNRRTITARPAVAGCQSSGSHSPPIRVASSAATANVNTARSTSARAALIGVPASRTTVPENFSCLWWIASEIHRRMRCRSNAGIFLVVSNARNAARTAASA